MTSDAHCIECGKGTLKPAKPSQNQPNPGEAPSSTQAPDDPIQLLQFLYLSQSLHTVTPLRPFNILTLVCSFDACNVRRFR